MMIRRMTVALQPFCWSLLAAGLVAHERGREREGAVAQLHGPDEALLVDLIRRSDRFVPELSIVAEVGGTVVAYEDLTRGSKFSAIADAADVPIDESILESKVGGTRQQRGEWDRANHELTATEMAGLRETAGRLGRALGYVGPSTGGVGS